ncbi:hypothetical protein TSUD_323780 [Trifolium subterraneum]|uniref:Uncharacterized protein n=1 Tax=Trifolium subterraneum TaxID=3900 RepID=A0A2Z6NF08_TRISU|nr:hypothetical protein TSUD_323780 [Trifolium subterraneum]
MLTNVCTCCNENANRVSHAPAPTRMSGSVEDARVNVALLVVAVTAVRQMLCCPGQKQM